MSEEAARFDLALPADKPFDVVGLGVNVINHLLVVPRFPEPDTKLEALAVTRQGGGMVATALVACARLGLATKYVGAVGADELGVESRQSLEKEGIDLGDLVVDPTGRTRFTVGLIEQSSGRRTLVRDAGELARVRPDDLSPSAVTAGRVLHLDGYEGAAALQAARWAREAGIPVSLDAEEGTECRDELIPLTDILIVAHRFGERLTGTVRVPEILDRLARRGPRIVGVTLGADGSAVRYRGCTVQAPGYAVDVVDTTGAGDAFHGAFLAGLLWGWPVLEILRLANTVAALKCRQLGGRAGIPTLSETRAFLTGCGVELPPIRAWGVRQGLSSRRPVP